MSSLPRARDNLIKLFSHERSSTIRWFLKIWLSTLPCGQTLINTFYCKQCYVVKTFELRDDLTVLWSHFCFDFFIIFRRRTYIYFWETDCDNIANDLTLELCSGTQVLRGFEFHSISCRCLIFIHAFNHEISYPLEFVPSSLIELVSKTWKSLLYPLWAV